MPSQSPEPKLVPSFDLHPHDPLLTGFFNELLAAKQELAESNWRHFRKDLPFTDGIYDALIAAALDFDGPAVTHNNTIAKLRSLLQVQHFVTALPVLVERLNTPVERLNLPRRGRSRNLDRGELDTFYTPIDLAVWVASLTTKRACATFLNVAPNQDGAQMLNQLAALHVCDFSCGSGMLLREAAEWIVRAYETLYQLLPHHDISRLPSGLRYFKAGLFKLQCLTTNLYGIDISAKSHEAASLVLLLWAREELRRHPSELSVVSRLLELNLRVGSGAHWEIGRQQVTEARSIHAACVRAAEQRSIVRERAMAGEFPPPKLAETTEIVHMFPEAFVDSGNPGFSCIVGNPPYGELPIEFEAQLSKSLFHGVPKTNRNRHQYTKFVSSLLYLLRDGGYGAMVAPLGLAYNNAETKALRREIQEQNRRWNFAFFDRSPDALFGDMVKTRNTVLFCEPSATGSPEIRTTNLIRWTRAVRPQIWGSVNPIHIRAVDITEFVPKVGDELELHAWKTIRSRTTYLLSSLLGSRSENSTLYCYATAYNWLPFFRSDPTAFADEGKHASPSTRQYRFGTPVDADFFYACVVSSLSFWLWTVESDGFHLTHGFVEKLPYSPDCFQPEIVRQLAGLGRQHDEVIRKLPMVKANAGRQILNFNRHTAQPIVEQIDSILICGLGISKRFFDVLQTRVRDLIFAGRKTTRIHPVEQV
ncbi:MAG TPA: hypothetical protein VG759_26395 [Candidatus Angelobacter sp.]|jgi:hypothetical protein|nr:hypothetical protein [Candidatus Angelobacter sp.]